MSALTSLQALRLSDTKVTGDIHCSNSLENLQHLCLTNTQLTGDISRLSVMDLVVLIYACQIDMDIATTTTLALGSKELTKHDALVIPDASEDMAGIAILRPCLMSCS